MLFTMNFSVVSAFHIAGGDFTYKWLGGNNFEVRLTLYRDCSNPLAADFDDSIKVSVYDRVTNLAANQFVMAVSVIDSLELTESGCVQPPEVCLQYGVYVTTISLADNPNGYYIVWERCCRNNTINNINLPAEAGMAFYAEIADPALHNSSPVFNNIIIPVFCVDQFFRFGFDATDADGDSLVYSLVDPLDGGHTSQFQPGPFSYLPSLNTPIFPDPAPYTTINWASGYGLNNICGSALPLTLNAVTGEMELQPDAQGIYAMAIEVKEYRNGIYIGLIRREIEFTVLVCGNNTAPQLPPVYSGNATINVYATDTINLTMSIIDANGDSIFLKRKGGIFDGSVPILIDPPYAISPDTVGKDTLETYFIWNTGCQHSSLTPYSVSYEATDNGCPLFLTDLGNINIHVNEPPIIAKSNLLCIDLVSDSVLTITRASDTAYVARYFNYFKLYRSINGSAFQLFRTITDINPLLLYDSTAYDNKTNDYCYVISAFNTCNNEGEWSDTLCSISHINTHKNYIESVSVTSDNEITLKWEYFNDGPYALYKILKADNDSLAEWQQYKTLSGYADYEWQDKSVNTASQSYCYAMINEDVCGNESDTSLIACSILLQGEADYYLNRINWSPYINFKGGIDRYEILRKSMNGISAFSNIADVSSGELIYFDRNMDRDNGIFRYVIRAVEASGGNNSSALSNEIELHQQPVIFSPSAFTPNNDGVNDYYKMESSFITEFNMVIYNRWGRPVFETSDIENKWNGTENNNAAPTGVYFYKILYKGFDDNSFQEKTGSITLLR